MLLDQISWASSCASLYRLKEALVSTTVGTISVMVLVQSGQWGEAAAFTVVLITIAFTVLRLAQWLLGRQGIKLEL